VTCDVWKWETVAGAAGYLDLVLRVDLDVHRVRTIGGGALKGLPAELPSRRHGGRTRSSGGERGIHGAASPARWAPTTGCLWRHGLARQGQARRIAAGHVVPIGAVQPENEPLAHRDNYRRVLRMLVDGHFAGCGRGRRGAGRARDGTSRARFNPAAAAPGACGTGQHDGRETD
jgi:hypothetical protein